MKVRFFHPQQHAPDCPIPAIVQQAIKALHGEVLELDDAVEAIQTACPKATVCAYGGFISIGLGAVTCDDGRTCPRETWRLIYYERASAGDTEQIGAGAFT